jgi:hypothetical protein
MTNSPMLTHSRADVCALEASGQTSSSCQGSGSGVDDTSQSCSDSVAREMALRRCLRMREAVAKAEELEEDEEVREAEDIRPYNVG